MVTQLPAPAPTDPTTIKVVARFRPPSPERPNRGSGEPCVEFEGEGRLALRTNEKACHTFEFDRVFHGGAPQQEVFEYTGRQIVDDVFHGYNGTIFVYGQTGAGKTHTMMGPNLHSVQGYCDDPEAKGIIPRVVERIFRCVQDTDPDTEFTLRASYVEIYKERIQDLLDPHKGPLDLREDCKGGRGVFIEGVTEAYITTAAEVHTLLRVGAAHRQVAATRMNAESSRSHSIFQITVTQQQGGEQRVGKLCLVDLAGSERTSKTGAEGLQLEEAKLINKSLSALGNVINALTDKNCSHVPYRDSKLTRLLQDSVGGNSRTTLIICCSPSKYNEFETLSTLRFGERAKRIKNNAKVNREWTVGELKSMLAKAEREIGRLRGGAAEEMVPLTEAWGQERDRLLERIAELEAAVELQQRTIDELRALGNAPPLQDGAQATEGDLAQAQRWRLAGQRMRQRALQVLAAAAEGRGLEESLADLQAEVSAMDEGSLALPGAPPPPSCVDSPGDLNGAASDGDGSPSLRRAGPLEDTEEACASPHEEQIQDLQLGLEEVQRMYRRTVGGRQGPGWPPKVEALEDQIQALTACIAQLQRDNITLHIDRQLIDRQMSIRARRLETLEGMVQEERRRAQQTAAQAQAEKEEAHAVLQQWREGLEYWKAQALGQEGRAHGVVLKVLRGGTRSPSAADAAETPTTP